MPAVILQAHWASEGFDNTWQTRCWGHNASEKLQVESGSIYIRGENAGLIIDSGTDKRIGFLSTIEVLVYGVLIIIPLELAEWIKSYGIARKPHRFYYRYLHFGKWHIASYKWSKEKNGCERYLMCSIYLRESLSYCWRFYNTGGNKLERYGNRLVLTIDTSSANSPRYLFTFSLPTETLIFKLGILLLVSS